MPNCCTPDNLEYLGPGLSGADYYRCTVCYRIVRAENCEGCKLGPDAFDTECDKCEVIKC